MATKPENSSNRAKIMKNNDLQNIANMIIEKTDQASSPQSEKMQSFTMRLPSALRAKIMALAVQQKRTEGDTVRWILDQYFEEQEKEK